MQGKDTIIYSPLWFSAEPPAMVISGGSAVLFPSLLRGGKVLHQEMLQPFGNKADISFLQSEAYCHELCLNDTTVRNIIIGQ